jgi:hypothetical protein
MFSLLGQKLSHTDGDGDASVFEEQDIRQILQTFTLDSPQQQLFLSSSKSGLVKVEEIEAILKSWTNQQFGRRSLSDIASSCDVDTTSIFGILQQPNSWSMVSADSSSIISKYEQEQAVRRLSAMAEKALIDEEEFCRKEDLRPGSAAVLLSRYSKILKGVELSRFQPSGSTKSFVVSNGTRKRLEQELTNEISKLEEYWKTASSTQEAEHHFKLSLFPGLDLNESLQLCREIKERNPDIEGIFKAGQDGIDYTPKSYLIFQREKAFDEFRRGNVPFLDINQFVGHLPGQFENAQEAMSFALHQQSNSNVAPLSFPPYIISDMWINNEIKKLNETVESEDTSSITVRPCSARNSREKI